MTTCDQPSQTRMVEDELEHMIRLCDPQEQCANQRPALEIERGRDERVHGLPYGRLGIALSGQITLLEVESRLVRHDEKGLARLGRERGAKRVVPPHHLSDRPLERVDVETAANPGAERHVVRARRA